MSGLANDIWVLVPVWGPRYVSQFLNVCLPSLLGEGNLPAMASRGECHLRLLICQENVNQITQHPSWKRLNETCHVHFDIIDHLVSDGSSVSITLAYVHALKLAGERITETIFIFLVSDYVVAEGSLNTLVSEIDSGYSGIVTGNFHAISERIAPQLEQFRKSDGSLSINPRELMKISIPNLHMTTKANLVEAPDAKTVPYHDPVANRLFWSAGKSTLIGRFFLMHMAAIRPETSTFSIGGPSDYSLIPELCPSGKVKAIVDTDRFCVVELQSKQEKSNTVFGPHVPSTLAASVVHWATSQHRQNASNELIFHSADITPDLIEPVQARAQCFIDELFQDLPHTSASSKQHPFWQRMLEHYLATGSKPLSRLQLDALLGQTNHLSGRSSFAERSRRLLFGRLPELKPWHPRWADWRMFNNILSDLATGKPIVLLTTHGKAIPEIIRNTLGLVSQNHDPKDTTNQVYLAFINPHETEEFHRVLATWASNLRTSTTLVVALANFEREDLPMYYPENVADILAQVSKAFGETQSLQVQMHGIPLGAWRSAVQTTLMRRARGIYQGGVFKKVYWMLSLFTFAAVSALINWRLPHTGVFGAQKCSSILITLSLQCIKDAGSLDQVNHSG